MVDHLIIVYKLITAMEMKQVLAIAVKTHTCMTFDCSRQSVTGVRCKHGLNTVANLHVQGLMVFYTGCTDGDIGDICVTGGAW